jgi:hypothetical protein
VQKLIVILLSTGLISLNTNAGGSTSNTSTNANTGNTNTSSNSNTNSATNRDSNQYHGNSTNYNDNGSAYQQADKGEKKANSDATTAAATGGVMIVGGGAMIQAGADASPVGTALIAAGVILVGMGGMEIMQSIEDKKAAKQAQKSKSELKSGFNPYDYTNNNGNDPTTPFPDNNSNDSSDKTNSTTNKTGLVNNNNTNGTDSGTRSIASITPGDTDPREKMANELSKYGIGFDKKTDKITLPDGQTITLDDIRKGKMPNEELQSAYNKAAATAQDLAANETSGSNSLAGGDSSANGLKGVGKGDSSLSKIAGGLKDGAADGASGSGVMSPVGTTDSAAVGGKVNLKTAAELAALAAKNKALASKVAGLSTNYNGEPIGVASDSIFEMIKRRYETKDKENSFITDLLTTTSY